MKIRFDPLANSDVRFFFVSSFDLTTNECCAGIRVAGKGSWKKREVGKFQVGKPNMKLERMKLECSV